MQTAPIGGKRGPLEGGHPAAGDQGFRFPVRWCEPVPHATRVHRLPVPEQSRCGTGTRQCHLTACNARNAPSVRHKGVRREHAGGERHLSGGGRRARPGRTQLRGHRRFRYRTRTRAAPAAAGASPGSSSEPIQKKTTRSSICPSRDLRNPPVSGKPGVVWRTRRSKEPRPMSVLERSCLSEGGSRCRGFLDGVMR